MKIAEARQIVPYIWVLFGQVENPLPPRPAYLLVCTMSMYIIYHIWLVDWQHGWLIAEGWSLPVCSYSKYSTNAVRCFPAFVCYWYKSGTGGAVRGTGGVVSGTGGAVCNVSYWHARTLGCAWLVCHRSLSETVDLRLHYAPRMLACHYNRCW